MIFIDASFFISFAIDTDPNHTKALTNFPTKQNRITSEDVIKETLTVISQRKGKKFCIDFFDGIKEDTTILPISSQRYQEGLKLFLDPGLQKDISLIDCISAAVCKERGMKKILTFDRQFRSFGLTVVPSY